MYNEGESRDNFLKLNTKRHNTPIVLELAPSHDKYTAVNPIQDGLF